MRKYQEPLMDILELENVDTIVASALEKSEVTDGNGNSLGGNEGSDWNDFWN